MQKKCIPELPNVVHLVFTHKAFPLNEAMSTRCIAAARLA